METLSTIDNRESRCFWLLLTGIVACWCFTGLVKNSHHWRLSKLEQNATPNRDIDAQVLGIDRRIKRAIAERPIKLEEDKPVGAGKSSVNQGLVSITTDPPRKSQKFAIGDHVWKIAERLPRKQGESVTMRPCYVIDVSSDGKAARITWLDKRDPADTGDWCDTSQLRHADLLEDK